METLRRHFRRRRGSVGLPTGKARRRSPAGQASSSLAQRRRSSSSAQLQSCFLGCGLGAQGSSRRRRSSTAPPACNPRFAVEEVPGLQATAVGTRLLGAPLLVTGLVGMEEEEEEGVEEEDATAGAPSAAQPRTATPGRPRHWGVRPRLPLPRCLRRASSHLLPADVVYGCALWGLHGCYRRLSQQRLSGQHLGPGGRRASGAAAGSVVPARVRPLCRRRQVALRRKSAGPQAWSALLV